MKLRSSSIKCRLSTLVISALIFGLSSTSAMATLAAVDVTGSISRYEFWSAVDPFAGSIAEGTDYSVRYTIDPTAIDRNSGSHQGVYSFDSGTTTFNDYTANIGGNILSSDQSFVTIYDNFDPYGLGNARDMYAGWTAYVTPEELVFMSVMLNDSTGTALADDSFITEPKLDSFDSANFWAVSYNLFTMNMNYRIMGNVATLVDPPINTVAVPEPSTLFLVGLALLGFGVTQTVSQRKLQRKQELTV